MVDMTLLDTDRAADAEAVYRADLQEYRQNGWALFGFMKSLEAQNKTTEATEVQKEFKTRNTVAPWAIPSPAHR